ncbi:MAG: OmpA family protein [Vicinamibacterales bacterium]
MMVPGPRLVAIGVLLCLAVGIKDAPRVSAQARGAAETPPPVDYLTFAQGAVPISVAGPGASLGANFEHAVKMIDGDSAGFTFVNRAAADTATEFVYELPAPTTFTRFAVPDVRETPSPTQTFTRLVEIHGSASGPADGFTQLGSATLRTHAARGQVTEVPVAVRTPVRWVRLRLVGGINVTQPLSSFEFSELIGNGTQEPVRPSDRFGGRWNGVGVRLELNQTGPAVSGCYDIDGRLTGTVSGSILRATGLDTRDNTPSLFVLSVAPDGQIRGVRSSNGGPFRLYQGPPATAGAAGPRCPPPPQPVLGCNSVIHGINFDFDSATIRAESTPILDELFRNLQADPRGRIVIAGHTSNEGTDAYNLRLSQQRAESVRADLVRRGLVASRVNAAGLGESQPIATNVDENGRALNRRVAVTCQ